MAVRVLRLMEYVYPDGETAARDMERWQVQGTKFVISPARRDHYIKSVAMAPSIFDPEPEPEEETDG